MLRADRSVHAHAAARVKDPALRFALSFHPLFIGGDPFRVTSMYALVSHLEAAFGVHYAMGGVQAIADAMVRVIEDQGGEVRLNTEADEILVRDGRAVGPRLKTGEELPAEVTVSNPDPGFTYGTLLRKPSQKKRWMTRRMTRSRCVVGCSSGTSVRAAPDACGRNAGHHTSCRPSYRTHLRTVPRGKLTRGHEPLGPSPTVTDPSADAAGETRSMPSTGAAHRSQRRGLGQFRPTYKDRGRTMLETADPRLRDGSGSSGVFTPETFRDRYLSPYGARFRWSRASCNRRISDPTTCPGTAGPYLAGLARHPGAGVPADRHGRNPGPMVPPPKVRARYTACRWAAE